MRYLSLCSGIEAATVAWHTLGWTPVAFSEIDKNPSRLLAHHYPNVPNLGDMTKFKEWPDLGTIDLICGGTPCQSFSVAGLRKGLDDPRGNLMLTYLAIAEHYRPTWLVWENVPGVLSSNGGRDFGTFLGAMGQLGYGFAYRILDAQHFGVPQRRRRVFVVGHLGDWRRAAAVLFERHSLQGHPAPRREARERLADTITGGASPCSGFPGDITEVAGTLSARTCRSVGAQDAALGHIISAARLVNFGEIVDDETSSTLKRCDYKSARDLVVTHSLRGEGFDASEDGTGRGTPLIATFAIQAGALRENPNSGPDGVGVQADTAYTLEARSETQCVAYDTTQITSVTNRSNPQPGDPCHTLSKDSRAPLIAFSCKDYGNDAQTECSPTLRSMSHDQSHMNGGGQVAVAYGIPGNWIGRSPENGGNAVEPMHNIAPCQTKTDVHAVATNYAVRRLTPLECERLQGFPDNYTNVAGLSDSARYKALGNSWAVPCARWIGERIAAVHSIPQNETQREAA